MRYYVAFDDTDTLDCGRGTGKLARWFTEKLPEECVTWGVVRQQLLNSPDIPKTSHNSSLCCVIDAPNENFRQFFIDEGSRHIKSFFVEGSDPGFCVASESDTGVNDLIEFGIKCCRYKVTQEEALVAARSIHLSGHGGTNDGIIGAAAAVGLTMYGESGRLVSYRDIRELPQFVTAGELRQREIFPVSANRHAEYIPDNQKINTHNSLRPHLSGNRLVIPVMASGPETWQIILDKKEEA
ncbi:hypothetical protein ACFLTA_00210 [Bacteroidota bacterium]